jgi:hypothetical protein
MCLSGTRSPSSIPISGVFHATTRGHRHEEAAYQKKITIALMSTAVFGLTATPVMTADA